MKVYICICYAFRRWDNQAEIQAASYGLNRCLQLGYNNIILEVDSELLTRLFLKVYDPPWRLLNFVKELIDLPNKCDYFQCIDMYREANSTAVFLFKQSHKQDIIQHYYIHKQLPPITRESYLPEKEGMPCFRRKILRWIQQPP